MPRDTRPERVTCDYCGGTFVYWSGPPIGNLMTALSAWLDEHHRCEQRYDALLDEHYDRLAGHRMTGFAIPLDLDDVRHLVDVADAGRRHAEVCDHYEHQLRRITDDANLDHVWQILIDDIDAGRYCPACIADALDNFDGPLILVRLTL